MEVVKYEYQGTDILYSICKYQFLNWSGASRPFLSTLGSIEIWLTSLNEDRESANADSIFEKWKRNFFALYGNDNGIYMPNVNIQIPPLIPLQTYTDVILSYAECLYKKGNISEAKRQLNKVVAAKNIIVSDKSDVLNEITELRKRELKV